MADRYLIRELELPEGVAPTEKQKKQEAAMAALKAQKETAIKKREEEKESNEKAAETKLLRYTEEYSLREKELAEFRRVAAEKDGFFKEPEARLIFCIRIKGTPRIAPRPRKILQLFRLLQPNNGVFIKVNKATLNMLQRIGPWVTFGYPSLEATREMIYRRGYAKVNRQRFPISENTMIKEELGGFGIECVEDLVHEIYTVGPNFKQANNFLWPFKLHPPRKGFTCKRHGFTEQRGGDWGNREDLISELMLRMSDCSIDKYNQLNMRTTSTY
eukprot:Filipodium_phascolosomae@DN979_c0_g1_i1.p1